MFTKEATDSNQYGGDQYASKLDEIAAKLPNLVGDHLALIAYAAQLRATAEFVRNPGSPNPFSPKGPDIRPDFKTLHEDGQSAATRPTVALAGDAQRPDLPIAVPDAASVANIAAMQGKKVGDPAKPVEPYVEPTGDPDYESANHEYIAENTPASVADKVQYGAGTDTQKGAGKPGTL